MIFHKPIEAELPGMAPLTSNSQPRKWLKPNCFAINAPIDLTKEPLPSSFQIEAFWTSPFTRYFPLVLSPWTWANLLNFM